MLWELDIWNMHIEFLLEIKTNYDTVITKAGTCYVMFIIEIKQ